MVLNIAALLMLIFVTGVVMYAIYFLGGLPGRVAKERHQPQADAIRIMGWLGLLTGGIVWGVALVWAYYTPKTAQTGNLSGEPEPATTNSVRQLDPTANLSHGA